MKIIPIPTRHAQKVAAIEEALLDPQARAQAMKDVEAFYEVIGATVDDEVEWSDGDLALFRDEFVAQSGRVEGEQRLRNLVTVLVFWGRRK
jgi:hypothetical protein